MQIEFKGSEHSFREFGYKSTHFLIHVPKKFQGRCAVSEPLLCEIQLLTILQDAWSEVEHELIYKKDFSPFDEPMKRKLAALNANLTLSDTLFQEIRDYQRKLDMQLHKRRESFVGKDQSPAAAFAESMQLEALRPSGGKRKKGSEEPASMTRNVDDLLLDALVAHNAGRFGQTIAIFSTILERDFQEHIKSIIHIHRGMAFFAESRYKRAMEDFTVAAELSPDSHRAFYCRGRTCEAVRDYQAALENFNMCLEINPYQFEPLYSRARLFVLLGDYAKAMADCRRALKIEPSSIKAKQLKKQLESNRRSAK